MFLSDVRDRLDWYEARGCTHAHCEKGCDKPQPSLTELCDDTGTPTGLFDMLCMRCLVIDGVRSRMIPCHPSTCTEADPTKGLR